MNDLGRRKYLRSCFGAIPLFGGCLSLTDYDGYAGIVVNNASEMESEVLVQVSRPNGGNQVFEKTYKVDAEERISEDEIVEQGVYTIRTTIADITNSEGEFELACDDTTDVDLAILLNEGYRTLIRRHCQ